MPSVAQKKLDELYAEVDSTARLAKDERDRADIAERRLRTYDDVLEKIVRAANGVPLIDSRNRGFDGYTNYNSTVIGDPVRKVKTEERQQQEIRDLNERIAGLESRLAAVVAVATFAKDHKA